MLLSGQTSRVAVLLVPLGSTPPSPFHHREVVDDLLGGVLHALVRKLEGNTSLRGQIPATSEDWLTLFLTLITGAVYSTPSSNRRSTSAKGGGGGGSKRGTSKP